MISLIVLCLGLLAGCMQCQVIIEGDMAISPETAQIMKGQSHGYGAAVNLKWPKGIVPYVFAGNFGSSRRRLVAQAIDQYNKNTCIKFVPRTDQYHYVSFEISNKGCWSWIGRQSRRNGQLVSIGYGCDNLGTVIHEMMHAIGFFHEQSRPDRDQFVKIIWANIQNGQSYNFQQYSRGQADELGEPYDINSLMHYTNKEFSRNGRNTIEAIGDPRRPVGNRNGFSKIDIRQINKMYSCKGTGGTTNTVAPPTGTCRDTSSRCGIHATKEKCKNNQYVIDRCQKSCGYCK